MKTYLAPVDIIITAGGAVSGVGIIPIDFEVNEDKKELAVDLMLAVYHSGKPILLTLNIDGEVNKIVLNTSKTSKRIGATAIPFESEEFIRSYYGSSTKWDYAPRFTLIDFETITDTEARKYEADSEEFFKSLLKRFQDYELPPVPITVYGTTTVKDEVVWISYKINQLDPNNVDNFKPLKNRGMEDSFLVFFLKHRDLSKEKQIEIIKELSDRAKKKTLYFKFPSKKEYSKLECNFGCEKSLVLEVIDSLSIPVPEIGYISKAANRLPF